MRQLARVIALRLPAPERPGQLARLRTGGFVAHERGPWVVGTKRVSGSVDSANGHGVFWAEGADLFPAATEDVAQVAAGHVDRLKSLPGDFSFLAIRPDGDLVAVRSVAGMVPWYHWNGAERTVVSSHLGDLAETGLRRASLDLGATAHYAVAVAFPGDRTFLRDVIVQRPASRVCIAPTGQASPPEAYWSPDDFTLEPPTRASFDRLAQEMRALLFENTRRLLSERANLLTVSGGVDSSVLAGLAVNGLGQSIHTLTFLAADRDVMTRDARYVDSLLESIRSGVSVRWERRITDEYRMQLLDRAPRELGIVRHPSICILPELIRETKLETLVGGEFADAVVGSGPNRDMWMQTLRWGDLKGRPDLWPFALENSKSWLAFVARRWAGRPRLTGPEVLPQSFDCGLEREYAESRASWVARCCRDPLGYFRLRWERASAIAGVHWEATAPLGIARGYPFWSRGMLELCLRTHPAHLMGRGSKVVLRRAAQGLAPSLNLGRTDKGHGGAVSRSWLPWRGDLPAELAGLVRPDWLSRPPDRLPAMDALLLRALVNIVLALRNKTSGKATP